MYDVVIRYLYAATGLLILYLLSVRSLVNDILVGSLPGKYGKADKKAACIRESHRFIERMTQKYIGQFVTEKYRGDYHFYMFLKAGLVAYYLLSLLALLVLAERDKSMRRNCCIRYSYGQMRLWRSFL